MTPRARSLTGQALVFGILAGGLARLTATDAFLAYVRPGMRIPLAATVVLLAVLAVSRANAADALAKDQPSEDGRDPHDHGERLDSADPGIEATASGSGHEHDHEHDHPHTPRIGWLLLLPVLCIAVVPLQPLGADTVGDRTANDVVTNRKTDADLAAEIPTGGDTKLLDYATRVINDPGRPYTDPVTLTGFVVDDPAFDDGFAIGRFVMSCCAADAAPVIVRIVTDEPPPPTDTWVEVTGTQDTSTSQLAPGDRALTENIRLDAATVKRIHEPVSPYESF